MNTTFTGLKYNDDCGWYAVFNGRIVCPEQGISGKKVDADLALTSAFAAAAVANMKEESTLEDCILAAERQAEKAFNAVILDGGAGSAEAMAAHANWMAARTQRATMDAL